MEPTEETAVAPAIDEVDEPEDQRESYYDDLDVQHGGIDEVSNGVRSLVCAQAEYPPVTMTRPIATSATAEKRRNRCSEPYGRELARQAEEAERDDPASQIAAAPIWTAMAAKAACPDTPLCCAQRDGQGRRPPRRSRQRGQLSGAQPLAHRPVAKIASSAPATRRPPMNAPVRLPVA